MHFLDTNQIGYDAQALGFPSVGTCQAIVYQTDAGLFGFHAASSNLANHTKKAGAFALYVQQHGMGLVNAPTRGIALIGVVHNNDRLQLFTNPETDWSDELTAVGDALGFNGPIYGGKLKKHIDSKSTTIQQPSAYIRFDWLQNARCKVSYKRWSKFEYDQVTAQVGDTNRQDLTQTERPSPQNLTGNWGYKDMAGDERNVSRYKVAKDQTKIMLHSEGSLNTLTSFTQFR